MLWCTHALCVLCSLLFDVALFGVLTLLLCCCCDAPRNKYTIQYRDVGGQQHPTFYVNVSYLLVIFGCGSSHETQLCQSSQVDR